MSDDEVLSYLAGGFKLRYDGNSSDCDLVQNKGIVAAETISRLLRAGLIESFANAGGYRISDKGMKRYLRAMDELSKPLPANLTGE